MGEYVSPAEFHRALDAVRAEYARRLWRRRRRAGALMAAALVISAVAVRVVTHAPSAEASVATFANPAANPSDFVVPAGVYHIAVDVYGANGADAGPGVGGSGGRARA